jgi:16S rRNA (adenine1518-N6/adenine1519-N6)-dimethyltransferase
MVSLKQIKELLQKHNISPKKSLGQNFLIDQNVLNKVVEAVQIEQGDKILEIGAGLGSITCELEKHAFVLAIEKDTVFSSILKEFNLKNTKIVEADILDFIQENNIGGHKVVGNIPYHLTSNLIRNLLETENQPKEMYLIIQKEVGERICKGKNNILSISVKYYALPKVCFNISKNSFWPLPKVDSVLIKILPIKKFEEKDRVFFKVLRAGFSFPRKKLINNLSVLGVDRQRIKEVFKELGLSENVRAEDLDVLKWVNLVDNFFN